VLIDKEIDEFIDNCLGREQTLYEALQFNDALNSFALHFAMKDDDEVLQQLTEKYFKRIQKEHELGFYR
jgi:hypothetical protein